MIYLAAPYGHEDSRVVEIRMASVTKQLAVYAKEGKVATSPLLMHFCLNSGIDLPGDFDFWKDYCFGILEKSDEVHVLCLEGWNTSVGVIAEVYKALELGIPVYLVGGKRFQSGGQISLSEFSGKRVNLTTRVGKTFENVLVERFSGEKRPFHLNLYDFEDCVYFNNGRYELDEEDDWDIVFIEEAGEGAD